MMVFYLMVKNPVINRFIILLLRESILQIHFDNDCYKRI